MRLRTPRARMRFLALLRLLGYAALSPRRLLARLRARGWRGRRDAAAESVAEAGSQPAAWEVTPTERATVYAAWAIGPASQLLVLLEGENSLQLTRRDLRTLRGSAWLNDEARPARHWHRVRRTLAFSRAAPPRAPQVVNFYLHLAVQRASEPPAARSKRGARLSTTPPLRTHVFSSHFFEKLACGREGYDFAAVRRWTKAVVRARARITPVSFRVCRHSHSHSIWPQDVFAYDLLLVPVNHDNSHWTLAAVWPASRRIEHYCSLGGSAGKHVASTLVRYLDNEGTDKSSPRAPPPQAPGGVSSRWSGVNVRAGVPRQLDGSACGVFVVAMAARLAAGRRPPFGLSQEHVPALRMRIAADCLARRATPV